MEQAAINRFLSPSGEHTSKGSFTAAFDGFGTLKWLQRGKKNEKS